MPFYPLEGTDILAVATVPKPMVQNAQQDEEQLSRKAPLSGKII
jgi:hypothetical protein